MTIGPRKSKGTAATVEAPVTGAWDDGGGLAEQESVVEAEAEQKERRKAEFVRTVTMVGRYPAGSILPASAFEFLENLLELGAVEYDHEATSEFIAGNPEHVALLASAQQLAPQTIPHAPWINASPANILGAKYIAIGRTNASAPTITPQQEPVATITLADPFPDTTG